MWVFVMAILGTLSGIVINILTAIKNDLLFPLQPRSLEEQLFSKVRGQSSLIHSQQDRLSYQAGVIQDQSRGIRERDDLLIQKDGLFVHRDLVDLNPAG